MYKGIRRERQLRIQSVSRPETTSTLSSQSRTIAIFLFALAGLISGFSVGAFVRPNLALPSLNSNLSATPPVTSELQTATHTPHTPHFVKLGWPIIANYSATEA